MVPSRPFLVDLGCACDAHTNGGLEWIFKAQSEEPPDGDIWAPHPNPYIRSLIERITERGLRRHTGLMDELRRWLSGAEHATGLERPARPAEAMGRWAPAEFGIVRAYLRALPAEQWALEDWLLLVDYLVQRYLPEDDLRTEADWMATRSSLMGRVQAAMAGAPVLSNVDDLLSAELFAAAAAEFTLTREQQAAIDFGRVRCAEHVKGFTDAQRQRLRNTIVDWQEATYLGDKMRAYEALQTRLLDQFGTMNRDWRRIAVTEVTENANQGFVGAFPPGTRLQRIEKYRGACAWCRQIDGQIVTVVDPAKPDKDGESEIWVGKTNVGRSASPKKRENGRLVDREPDERWWIAAGAQHPHCRGSWVEVTGSSPDPEFAAWLQTMKRRGRRANA